MIRRLDLVSIPTPCGYDWNKMSGDEQTRFCPQCAKHVYNLSAMTREKAEETLTKHEGGLCVRLFRRPDGTVVTHDCAAWHRRIWHLAASGAILATALVMFAIRIFTNAETPGEAAQVVREQSERLLLRAAVPVRPAPAAKAGALGYGI
jgi:hypothetical protein